MPTTTTTLSIDSALVTAVRALEKEIGHTPLHRVTRLFHKEGVTIYAKKNGCSYPGA